MKKDYLKFSDLTPKETYSLLAQSLQYKKGKISQTLKGQCLGLLFEKESTRTRVSFEVAMSKLGGNVIMLDQRSSQISRGETYTDTARVLSGYLDALVMRTFSHQLLEQMAKTASIPVINGLTDEYHPCQVLADLLTILEKKKDFKKLKILYIGDGNNMANTWIEAASFLNFQLIVSSPKGFEVSSSIKNQYAQSKNISFIQDPFQAVKDVDVINTDTWFSMGQKEDESKRLLFQKYQVNKELVSLANKKAIILHCLPAHRGEEITDEIMDGPQSAIFDQAENRLYVQMALLNALMK